MSFQPNFRHFADVMANRRPERLPVYEHIISPVIMERIVGTPFSELISGDRTDQAHFFKHYCGFFRDMTYDVITYEVSSRAAGPGPHALSGGMGPIQTREDFEAFPWEEVPELYWQVAAPRFDALRNALPPGMKVVGGIGNGVFEFAEDLVGLEYLPFMQADDPQLYADLYVAIGTLLGTLWAELLRRYRDVFVACRFGDDLGFKSSLLTNPGTVRQHIIPQYRRIIEQIHAAGKPFLWHSCGCIFEVMEDVIALGIEAKHSNEDAIAPFDEWIERYGDHIGLIGGFDMDFLCIQSEEEVYEAVLEQGARFRANAKGYALGSGNSIPDYVPTENYLAMIRAAQELRRRDR